MKPHLFLTLGILLAACAIRAADRPATANSTNTFAVTGMHCDDCAKGIASELKRTPGVLSASVSFSNQLAVVALNTNRVNAAQLIKVIEEAGYQARLQKP